MNRVSLTPHGYRAKRHIRAIGLLLAVLCIEGCPTEKPPEAAFEAFPTSGPAPLAVTFDAAASRDPDGEIVSFAWQFPNAPTATGVRVQHTFEAPGEYVVDLTVTDDSGLSATATKTIRVSESDTTSRQVGPAGGTLDFGGGLTMTFPAGAVSEDTVVTARPIRASDVEGLFGTSLPSLEETRILGGFVAESSIRQFDVPVVVAVPLRPPVDEGARLAHARVNDSGDALKLSTTALPIDPSDGSARISVTSFSPNIIFEYAQYLSLTSPDAAVKLQMFLAVDQAYRQGNRGDEGFLDFSGGQQQALGYLASRIGRPYDGANVFCGFDLTIVSTVISVDPPGADMVNTGSVSTSKDSCGEDFTRLYEGEPWINAALQNRSYTNTVVTPNTEKQEVFDIAVTAYIRPHNVKFLLDRVTAGLNIVDARFVGEEWVMTNQDFSRTPIDTPVASPVPMPAAFAEEVMGTYRGGTGRARVEMEVVKDGWGFVLRSAGSATKQDGRYLYLGEWSANPLTGVYSPVDVTAIVRIDNPEAREVTVRVEHNGRCDGPEALKGPWHQQYMDIMPITANDPENPTIIPIYSASGDDATSHAGSTSLRYREEEIALALFFTPHHIRATDFFAEQLKYRIGCSSEVTVTVLGLGP